MDPCCIGLCFPFGRYKTVQWIQRIQAAGSSSSPMCIDPNKDGILDGILDCVLGAGLNEFD